MTRPPPASDQRPLQRELFERVLQAVNDQLAWELRGTWTSTANWLYHAQKCLKWARRYYEMQPRTQNIALHGEMVQRIDALERCWHGRLTSLSTTIYQSGSKEQHEAIRTVQKRFKAARTFNDTTLTEHLAQLVISLKAKPKPVRSFTDTMSFSSSFARPGWQRDPGRQPSSPTFLTGTAGRRFRN